LFFYDHPANFQNGSFQKVPSDDSFGLWKLFTRKPYITIQGADQGASKKELRRLQTAKSFGHESNSAIEKHEMSTCR